jgi:hypothetical protein
MPSALLSPWDFPWFFLEVMPVSSSKASLSSKEQLACCHHLARRQHTINDDSMLKSGIGGVGDEEKHIHKPDQPNLASPLFPINGELPWMDIAETLASGALGE